MGLLLHAAVHTHGAASPTTLTLEANMCKRVFQQLPHKRREFMQTCTCRALDVSRAERKAETAEACRHGSIPSNLSIEKSAQVINPASTHGATRTW